jgi:hypothetical protein
LLVGALLREALKSARGVASWVLFRLQTAVSQGEPHSILKHAEQYFR